MVLYLIKIPELHQDSIRHPLFCWRVSPQNGQMRLCNLADAASVILEYNSSCRQLLVLHRSTTSGCPAKVPSGSSSRKRCSFRSTQTAIKLKFVRYVTQKASSCLKSIAMRYFTWKRKSVWYFPRNARVYDISHEIVERGQGSRRRKNRFALPPRGACTRRVLPHTHVLYTRRIRAVHWNYPL